VFPLAGSSPPTDLDSLLDSDPSTHPPDTSRRVIGPSRGPVDHAYATHGLVDLVCAARGPADPACATRGHVDPACATRGHAAPACASSSPGDFDPSTGVTRFADPAIVYRRRGSAPPSAPTNPGPSTDMARLADTAVVHPRRKPTTSVALEPSVYHPVVIHRDPGHTPPMVTRHVAGVRPVDRLILAADTSATPPNASPVPSSVCTALADPHWRRAMEEYAALLANHT
jgi:hypothetical protein